MEFLNARGELDDSRRLQKRGVKNIKLEQLPNGNFKYIERGYDYLNIKSIHFRNVSEDFNFNKIEVIYNNIILFSIDKKLCNLLHNNKYEKFEDIFEIAGERYINYNLPIEELYINNILLNVSYGYEFKVYYDGTANTSITGNIILCDMNEHRILYNPHEQLINQYFTLPIEHTKYETTYKIVGGGPTNGLFFTDINIYNLDGITLSIFEDPLINLDRVSIRSHIRKISETEYYMPFDGNYNFLNLNLSTTLNLQRLPPLTLKIEGQNFSGNIHYISKNVMRYMSGQLFLVYTLSSSLLVDDENISKDPQFTYINKLIEGDVLCPVNYENINENELYMCCETCKNNFQLKCVKEWITEKKKCPMCKSEWKNKIIYCNK